MAEPRWRLFAGQLAAALVLCVAAIPIALTATLVWVVLGRPIVFTQVRAGLGMKPFTIRKFRTMHDQRDASGKLLPDNIRETPVTRLIRRVRLDELPQLLAILRGDMAFIGPRPLLPATIREFGEFGRRRCFVRPGLTGWSQVSGNTLLSDRQKLALDLWYVEHRSFALDATILWQTLATVVSGERIDKTRIAVAEADLAASYGNWMPGVDVDE